MVKYTLGTEVEFKDKTLISKRQPNLYQCLSLCSTTLSLIYFIDTIHVVARVVDLEYRV